jgi:uncharacterized BrkB/YihY/UPF0761 family membrane protein
MEQEGDGPKLTPEQIEAFVQAVERLERRRKMLLLGYLLCLIVLVFGMIAALVIYGYAPRGSPIGWVFLVPMGLVGAILWLFGRWARKEKERIIKKPGG